MESQEANGTAQAAGTDAAELQTRLVQLRAAATKEDALKNYAAAADHYSEATEIQAELNGEMSVENADLLYLYGRCLYHVAVSKSDVLGGKVTGEETRKRKRGPKASDSTAESATTTDPVGKSSADTKTNGAADDKPYFQIEGDENWTDSEGEDVDQGADGPAENDAGDDDDDFATAYEILDVARVLLTRKIEDLQHTQNEAKGKDTDAVPLSPQLRALTERLADTRDLQAEISLENERFVDAIADSRASLDLKSQYLAPESSLIAEAHFKLSLALEFASVTTVAASDAEKTDGAELAEKGAQIDEEKRREAALHMEKAIESCRLRIEKEKTAQAGLDVASDEHTKIARSVEDVEDMVRDMEARLVDLRNPSVAVDGADPSGSLGGILSSMMGATPAQQKAKLEQMTKGANDLTSMVRNKKQQQPGKTEMQAGAAAVDVKSASAKRKLDDNDDVGNGKADETNNKKVKLQD